MNQVGNHGIHATIMAFKTFPMGFTISKFSDDVAPIEFSPTQVADHEFLVDGSLFKFDTSAMVSVKISVIPGSEDDNNLNILLNSSRSLFKIGGFPELLGISIMYPNQSPIILSSGYMRTGMFGTTVMESGRSKGKTYEFVFENTTQMSMKGLVSAGISALGSLPSLPSLPF